jgi:hypothetical protein
MTQSNSIIKSIAIATIIITKASTATTTQSLSTKNNL